MLRASRAETESEPRCSVVIAAAEEKGLSQSEPPRWAVPSPTAPGTGPSPVEKPPALPWGGRRASRSGGKKTPGSSDVGYWEQDFLWPRRVWKEVQDAGYVLIS